MRLAVRGARFQILEKMPRGHGELSDQLRRLQTLVEPDTAATAKALSVRIVSMLSKMCR
jgi:hypothetical protein